MKFESTEAFARKMDEADPLAKFRERFHLPKLAKLAKQAQLGGKSATYLAGNSLGLQPKTAQAYIDAELEDWAKLGVEGHLQARHPWLPYHEFLLDSTARLVGAKPTEVVTMGTLSANLHFLMASFYRPTQKRYKILIEADAFPSDRYAVRSQARFHGFDPAQAVLEAAPRAGERTLRMEDLLATIDREGDSIALIWIGNVNYLTGQCFDIPAIVEAGHRKGCQVGFDLAHGAGNLLLKLHDWNVDCAAWCSYKYLNAGPGAIAGIFVHERWVMDRSLPRLEGWWGHDKATRFKMPQDFAPIPTAEAWQLSNPGIFQLAALRASMEIFDEATMPAIRAKGDLLTAYAEFLLDALSQKGLAVITPRDPKQRGCQLSLSAKVDAPKFLKGLSDRGVIADFREPDIIRIAPAPLYNSFMDVYRFVQVLKDHVT